MAREAEDDVFRIIDQVGDTDSDESEAEAARSQSGDAAKEVCHQDQNKDGSGELFQCECEPVSSKNEAKKRRGNDISSSSFDDKKAKPGEGEPPKKRGFQRGLEPYKILAGTADAAGELMYLIAWKGCSEVDLVTAREANVRSPAVVIKFYEDRLVFAEPEEATASAS